MILVFSLRTVIDTTKFDRFNRDTWRTLLEPFGYVVDEKFYEELLACEAELDVHQTLLPLTMPSDYASLQHARYQSLDECIKHARPLDESSTSPFPLRPGVLEFLESVPRYVLSDGEERSYTYLLSNLRVATVRAALARVHSDLFNCFDLVAEYASHEQHYRDMVRFIRNGGQVDSSSSSTSSSSSSSSTNKSRRLSTCDLAESFGDVSSSSELPPRGSAVVFFESTAEGVRKAVKAGGVAVGVAVGKETPAQLSAAGALFAVADYASLRLEYLPLAMAASHHSTSATSTSTQKQ